VYARQDYADIMDGLRNGRIWVTTGDLITSLGLTAKSQGREAATGRSRRGYIDGHRRTEYGLANCGSTTVRGPTR
jgi:hypothetical protein